MSLCPAIYKEVEILGGSRPSYKLCELKGVKENSSVTLYPLKTSSSMCTMLLVSNLAHPQWINIDCDKPALDHYVCFNETIVKDTFNMVQELGTTTCPSLTVLNQGTCFLFKWFNGSRMIYTNNKNCENNELTPYIIKEPKRLSFLVTATSLDEVSLLCKMSVNSELIYVIKYQRTWYIQVYDQYAVKLQKAAGYLVCGTKVKMIQLDYNNTFLCSSGETISKLYQCDGINHCLDRINSTQASDERASTCVAYPKKQRHCSGSGCICSPLHFKSTSGNCLIFWFQISDTWKVNVAILEKFTCKNNSTIDMSLLDDLISDCGPSGEDEPMLKALLTNGSSVDCPSEGQFPCRSGHLKCYNYDQICVYILDKQSNLYPCRTGAHIQECKEFECHQYYKCPEFYCIPWTYVCDGKWDCPYGYDEKEEHNCGLERQCKGMLKCLRTQICVHLYDICNDYPDCPFKDDEDLCELKYATCPEKCVCLYFAMKCEIVTKQLLDLSNSPYTAIHISSSLMSSVTFLKEQEFISVLNISSNFVAHICETVNY